MDKRRNKMTFIKKIFQNKIDEEIHKSFTRFSKGIFENRALSNIKVSKDKFKIKMSYDLVKDTIELIANNIKKAEVSGKIIKSKKKTEIEEEVTSDQLKNICQENDFVLLDINSDEINFKCKKSIPKPGKALDTKFASGTLPLTILNEFVFDYKEKFKQVNISHTLNIQEIIIPKEYQNDFS